VTSDAAGNADATNNRIRAVLYGAIPIQASVSALTFSAASGGSAPSPKSVTLTSLIPGIFASISSSASWLSVSPLAGNTPAVLQVSVDITGLAAGSYTGSLTISAAKAVPSSITIGVTLTVSPPAPAGLGVSSQNIAFVAAQGSGPVTQALQVLDTGGGSLPFTAVVTSSGGQWLSLSSQSGTATPSAPAAFTVIATPGSLASGTYSGSISITAGSGASQFKAVVPVTLSISPPSGILLVSQEALTFNSVAQGGAPLPQQFGMLNTGQGSINWSASASTVTGGNWLRLLNTSGTVQTPVLDVSTVRAAADTTGLAPGSYYGKIVIASNNAVNSPQSLTVILNVLPPGTQLGPQIYPNGLIFTGVAGATPGSQDVLIANTSAAPNNYQSGAIGPVSSLPTNATLQPSQPTTLHVYPDFSNLAPGVSRGTIALQFSDGSAAQAINVLMSVAPAAGSTFDDENGKLEPRASTSCPPQALNIVFRLPQQPALSFQATVGQSTTLEVAISDSCGNAITPGNQQPRVLVVFNNGDAQQAMTHIGNGVWQASWRPVNAGQLVTASVSALIKVGTALASGTSTVHGAVIQPSAATPLVTAQGVVHAASDAGGIPIAPGELISIYGANLATGSSGAPGLPRPLSSNGTQVFLGTQPLPILYTSSGQMNVQVPYTSPVNTTFQLSVQNGSTLSVPQTVTVATASPGIFTTNQKGFGQGAILKSDGVTLAQPATPAAIGETIIIYCTGLGAVTPTVTEGQPAPATPVLAATSNPTTVTIGGQSAPVAFSGLSPGFAGLYQVNAVVPSGIATGDAVPVTVTVAGQSSQPGVTMSVH
jgi:uncharacterized protein (TIGR03437 family)